MYYIDTGKKMLILHRRIEMTNEKRLSLIQSRQKLPILPEARRAAVCAKCVHVNEHDFCKSSGYENGQCIFDKNLRVNFDAK